MGAEHDRERGGQKTGLKRENLERALRDAGTEFSVPPGAVVLRQGDADCGVRLIISGTADIISITESGDSLWLGQALQGHILGDAAYLSGDELSYEIIAANSMKMIAVSKEGMDALMARNPELFAAIAECLASKFNAFAQHTVQTIRLSSTGKVCAELSRLAVPIGIEPEKYVIRPVPQFSDLGAKLGISRETVSRTVSNLSKSGILSRKPGAIVIENIFRLEQSVK